MRSQGHGQGLLFFFCFCLFVYLFGVFLIGFGIFVGGGFFICLFRVFFVAWFGLVCLVFFPL